jgi:type II secretory pathway component PulF
MAYYKIYFLGEDGSRQTAKRKAESKKQAIAACNVPESSVLSVAIDHFGGITASLTDKKFPLVEQALMLSATASKLFAGKTFDRAIVESVPFKKLGVSQVQVDVCQSAHEYLELFRFDETAILLVDAGEKAGVLADALYNAANSITEREKDRKEFGRTMTQGILYSCLGGLFSVVVPLWAGKTLLDFITVQKIDLELNALSEVLLSLYWFYTTYTLPIIGVAIGLYLFRYKLWNSLRRLPVLSFINERMKVKRGLDFVQTFQLLRVSGFTNPKIFSFLHARSKGLTFKLYGEAVERVNEGRPLSSVFNTDEWPAILHQNLSGFDALSVEGRDLMLINLVSALRAYYLAYSNKISKACLVCGFALIILSILVFAIGFYFPLITFNASISTSYAG